MTGKIIKFRRKEKLGLLERLYPPMIVQGLLVPAEMVERNMAVGRALA
jgi:hypothetical protein